MVNWFNYLQPYDQQHSSGPEVIERGPRKVVSPYWAVGVFGGRSGMGDCGEWIICGLYLFSIYFLFVSKEVPLGNLLSPTQFM